MKTTFTKDELLQLRALIENAIDDLDKLEKDAQTDKPRHELGAQITLHNSDYGDILMDCVHVYGDGGSGLYLMHYGLPNMEFDAAESDGRGKDYGNNDYGLSNVRQWLNLPTVDWWERTHTFDAPPSYADKPGFLHGFDAETMARIVPSDAVGCDRFFLLSYEDVTGEIPYFQTEAGKKLLEKTDRGGNRVWWWLRSPHPLNTNDVRVVNTGGNSSDSASAYDRGGGVAAACVIA